MTQIKRAGRPAVVGKAHTILRLAGNLLLVFKPRGHREREHTHLYGQRLRVLRGALRVRRGKQVVTLRPESRPLTLPAGRAHETRALADTWVVVESRSQQKQPRD